MYFVHVASELAPVAKVGGLGDVLYGLSKELVRQGHTVEIILPKYDCLHYDALKNLKVEQREIWSYEGTSRYNNTIWSANVDGLKVLLIEPHHPLYYFSRGMIYGCPDDVDRFTYFSRATLEYLFKAGKHPHAIHVHDWHTALIPVLYKEMYNALGYRTGGTVLTIHNMEHQGRCHPFNLSRSGLRAEMYLTPDKLQDPGDPKLINLLKGGIEYADKITTVSPTYEKEIQSAPLGFGLEETLVKNHHKMKGILNGIDEEFWGPEKDNLLVQRYSTHEIAKNQLPKVLQGKFENKKHLRTHLQLNDSDEPIVVSISRLVFQKSPELIKHAFESTVAKGAQCVILGSTPSTSIQHEFENLHHENGRVMLDYNEAMAHLIFAAADMIVIPSKFEPCGLTQLIALRYGTIPIARLTGGLADTVHDIDTSHSPLESRNGYTFKEAEVKDFEGALTRAINCYRQDPQKWQTMMLNGMRQDFSWKRSASEYLSVYQSL